jgi:hypothetical protein
MPAIISQRVQTTTNTDYVPVSIDGILNSNVFYARLFQREQKVWSGRDIKIPLQYAKPATGGIFSGAGNFNTQAQDTRILQTFTHSQFYQNVTIIGGEASLNKTDAEVLDLMYITMEETIYAAADSMGDMIYDVGVGADEVFGLGSIVDNGTNTSSYAGLTRTTYPMLNSTVQSATNGVLDFSLMGVLFRGASAAGSGRQRPSIVVTDETSWDLLESKYTPTTQNNYDSVGPAMVTAYAKPGVTYKQGQSLGEGQMGFECLRWRGIPVVADEKCPSGYLYELNEQYLNWYKLNGAGLMSYTQPKPQIDGVASENKVTYPLQWTGLQRPTDQYAEIGQFIALGNVICGSTRRQALGYGITQG